LTIREEDKMPRKIFELKTDEITGSWRKLNNKELHNLYILPQIIRIIRSSRIRWQIM
jgi:hypothetical protein